MAESKGSLTLRFDYRWVVAVLLLVIVVMIVLWRPWEPRYDRDARTIDATGETVVKATPDEFAFYPLYAFKNADKAAALAESSKKSSEIVSGLKKLGVSDSSIKTSVNGYTDYVMPERTGEGYTYSLSVTVTLSDKDLAQKVQDYLVSTGPEGGVSAQPTFSETKRKELEKTAREQAAKDARSKAEQLAKNLGGKVGDVKSIADGNGFGGVTPMYDKAVLPVEPSSGGSSMTLQPGENELRYAVTVVYYLQ